MSFLTWAFALGALGVAFPVLFHLIRPTPKGSQPFSSLMFLRESPPRISRRSRIDNWLLLLLRALIILLLAAAFMRPFFRTGGEIFVSDLPGKRVAILVDTSASMKRGDLWQQVREQIDQTLDQLEPGDNVALFAFDDKLQTIVGFSEDNVVDLASRTRFIRDRFSTMKPTWNRTDIGTALSSAADLVSELDEQSRNETGLQIVLVSDMQKGADFGTLQSVIWPEDVRVRVCTLSLKNTGNATARVLPDEITNTLDNGYRVRLTHSGNSRSDSFTVSWVDASGTEDVESRHSYYVPPGSSQILRIPVSQNLNANRLVVNGDDSSFDNEFFVTTQSQQQVSIAYFGDDRADDSSDCLYFLSRAIPETKARRVQVEAYPVDQPVPWNDGLKPRLAIVTSPVSDSVAGNLLTFVREGGLLLALVTSAEVLDSLKPLLTGVSLADQPNDEPEDYAMLADIEFSHPLFAPLSGPQFNDFTTIRFWNHLPLQISDINTSNSPEDAPAIIAAFDDHTPAIWQQSMEKGTVIGWSSSWRPKDSQLALSTKFVPLINSLLAMTQPPEATGNSVLVGAPIQLPQADEPWNIRRPDGQTQKLESGQSTRGLLDMPGIFEFENGDQHFEIAVNLDPSESRISPLDQSRLESFDVRLGTQPSREEIAGSLRRMKDNQLENRQRVWKWLLVAAICLLVLETLVAGKRASHSVFSEATTT